MARNLEFNEEAAIQKAMEVFWKKGYTGASLRDLTDAMQINVSSLYNTIGDKHELFVKCIKNYTETRMEEAKKHAAAAKSPLIAIINIINGAAAVITNGENSCLAIKTTFEVAADDLSVQTILKADSDFTYDLILSLIKKGRESGEMSKDEDPEVLTDYLLNSFTGWYQSYILQKDPVRINKMAKFLIKQVSK
jgi:TetR/AcrR family transcriptional repressor of nem operon